MNTLNLIGLILNLTGTILVSICAGRVMTCMHTALMAHQLTLETYFAQTREIPVFTGLDDTRDKELKRSNRLLRFGLILIITGFLLQAIAAAGPFVAAAITE
jgi:hypothetical protein